MKKNEFTNFTYRMIDSNTDSHKAVEVSYERNGKPVKRYLFIKIKNGTNYIDEAKKIIQKELNDGSLNKSSKKFITNSHKSLKVALATVLGIGAVTFSGLYTWKYFQSAQLQESLASIEETINLIKELNPESSEDAIKAANDAYEKLTDEEKAKLPQTVVTRLEKQTQLFNEDKRMAVTLETTTDKIKVPEEALIEDVFAARAAYIELTKDAPVNNYNRRIKLLSKSLQEYDAIITAAERSCDDDIEAVVVFVRPVRTAYLQEREYRNVDEDQVKGYHQIYDICVKGHWRRELLAEEAVSMLEEIERHIAEDKTNIETYENAVDTIYEVIDTCNAEDIALVQAIYDEDIAIIRRPTLQPRISAANEKFTAVKTRYKNDATDVKNFVKEVERLNLNSETCTDDDIKSLEDKAAELNEKIKRTDLRPELERAIALLTVIREKYNVDRQLVDVFKFLVNQINPYNGTFEKYTIDEYMVECMALINGAPGKRSDLLQELNGIKAIIEIWKNSYNTDYSNASIFVIKENSLNDIKDTCSNEEIIEVESWYNEYVKIIQRPSMLQELEVGSHYQDLLEIREAYDLAKAAVKEFVEGVQALTPKSVTAERLFYLDELRQYIDGYVHHEDIFAQFNYKEACEDFKVLKHQYATDEVRTESFTKAVTALVKKETETKKCEPSDFDPLYIEYEELTNPELGVQSEELLAIIENSKVDLDGVKKAYEDDLDAVKEWEKEVKELTPGDDKKPMGSTEEEIKHAEETYVVLDRDIKRDSLRALFPDINEKLMLQRALFNADKAAGEGVNEFIADNDFTTNGNIAFLISCAESYRDEPESRAHNLYPRARGFIDDKFASKLMTEYSHLDLGKPGENHAIDVIRNEEYKGKGYIPTGATSLDEKDAFDYTTRSEETPIGRGEAFAYPFAGVNLYDILSIDVTPDMMTGRTLYFKEFHYGTRDITRDAYYLVAYDQNNNRLKTGSGKAGNKYAEIEINFDELTISNITKVRIALVREFGAGDFLNPLNVSLGDLLFFKN